VMGTLVKKGQKKWQILLQPLSKMSKNKKAYILEPKEVDSYSINFPTLSQNLKGLGYPTELLI